MDSGNTTPPELWASLKKNLMFLYVFILCFQRYTVFPRYTSVQHALQCFLTESYLPIVKYILAMLNRCVSPRRITEKKEWMVVHPLATLRMFTKAARKWELSTRERTSPASTTSSSVYPKYGGSKHRRISQDPFGTTSETLLNFLLGDPLVYTNMYPTLNIPNDEHGRVVSTSTARTPFKKIGAASFYWPFLQDSGGPSL